MNDLVTRYRQEQARGRVLSRLAATKAPAVDVKAAEDAAKKADQRYEENHKTFQSLKKVLKDPDTKKFTAGYGKLFKNGDAAVKAAKSLVDQYVTIAEGMKGRAKQRLMDTLSWLDSRVDDWGYTKRDMNQASRENRLANVYASAQQLEAALRGLPAALQGKEEALDDSWRSH